MSTNRYVGPPIGVTRLCENCRKPHCGAYRTGRFCSKKCGIAARVSASNSPAAVAKLRQSVRKAVAEGRWHFHPENMRIAQLRHVQMLKEDPTYRRACAKSQRDRWKDVPLEERRAYMNRLKAKQKSQGAAA